MTQPPLTARVRVPDLLTDGHPFRQWRTWTIPGTGLTLTGYSRANDKTFFHIPELNCCLDAGLCEGRQPEKVLLTHTHGDHVADLEFLAGRAQGADIYVPRDTLGYVERYILARRELNHAAPFDPSLAAETRLHPVEAGDTLSVGKRDAYQVEVFDCIHKVPCVGYGFSRRETRLLPELAALRERLAAEGRLGEFGREMAQRRKAGAAVEETILVPAFAFVGDTHASLFAQSPALLRYPVLITECTFLSESERERADRVGHTLWSQLRPFVVANPQTTFVLIHFSLRHSDQQVIEFFEEEVAAAPPGELDNLVIWASRDALLHGQHQSQR